MEAEMGSTVPMQLRATESWLLNGLTLKGIPAITKVSYANQPKQSGHKVYDERTGGEKIEDKAPDNWIIETDGVALKEVLAVDRVDYARTMSNSVREVL